MTKVDAIKNVLNDNGGIAVWNVIYSQIEKYYPDIKKSKEWKAGIRGVLYRDLGKSFKMVDDGIIASINYDENKLSLDETINETTKSILASIRVGQEKFRKKLLFHLKYCPITGIDDTRLLSASHIKPWALSTNKERMDVYNGFIFSPMVDRLFDKGVITFGNDKRIIISSTLSEKNINKIGIERNKVYKNLPIENRLNYLAFHRANIFIPD